MTNLKDQIEENIRKERRGRLLRSDAITLAKIFSDALDLTPIM